MKQIIHGRLYDTDTAKHIANASYRYPGDFSHWDEDLYRKRTGEYFIWGEGGPASKYGVSVEQNTWSGGSKIVPLTLEEAREWGEKYMDADDYMDEFGPVSEDESRVTLSVSLDAATADRIRKAAQQAGTSVSAIIASKF